MRRGVRARQAPAGLKTRELAMRRVLLQLRRALGPRQLARRHIAPHGRPLARFIQTAGQADLGVGLVAALPAVSLAVDLSSAVRCMMSVLSAHFRQITCAVVVSRQHHLRVVVSLIGVAWLVALCLRVLRLVEGEAAGRGATVTFKEGRA